MQVVYAREEFPTSWTKSIFLAGPTPRSSKVKSWRPEALRILEESGYDGVVFVPEDRAGQDYQSFDYGDQVAWEHQGLQMADCALFWVPRDLKTLPGFTTNVEFGWLCESGKVVLGYPASAAKMEYFNSMSKKFFIPNSNTLEETVVKALDFIGAGALRTGGECQVPIHIWRTKSFQDWHKAQKAAGNRLDGARLEWNFRVGARKDRVYCWALHVNVYVAKENRHKSNEVVISRPNIASVLLYKRESDILDSKIVLVREFRSPASTSDGFVWELPGGSSFDPQKIPYVVAHQEVFEETGLQVEPGRMKPHFSRQLAGTFSAHKAYLFSVELTDQELGNLYKESGIPHGEMKNETGERTYIEIKTLKEVMAEDSVDWSNLGMILSVLERGG